MAETHLSAEAHERLASELQDLKTRGRIDIARQIEAARALGDLSENGDYHAAKDSQGKMEARIRQLEAMLDGAVIVEPATSPSASVEAGSVVSIRYEGDDEVEKCLIGSIEERRDDLMVVSPGSPLGMALVGKKAGDVVTYEAPNGQLSVEIVALN